MTDEWLAPLRGGVNGEAVGGEDAAGSVDVAGVETEDGVGEDQLGITSFVERMTARLRAAATPDAELKRGMLVFAERFERQLTNVDLSSMLHSAGSLRTRYEHNYNI